MTDQTDKPEVIGVDIGGTAIKLGRILADGTCVESFAVPTPRPATPDAVIEKVAIAVNKLNVNKKAIALGLGIPGPADPEGRIALVSINLKGWENIPVADRLEKITGLPTVIDNDANCAGLGEAWLGAGRDCSNLILLTLGTGVGGAIILNGKLFTGRNGSAGELGLITLNPDGHPCNSGNQGSLEQHTSATAIIRNTGKTPADWGKLADENDPEALAFWQDYGKTLATGIASLVYVLTPELVIIGGGVCASAKYFLPALEIELHRRVMATSRIDLKIVVAALGNNAGITGAAKLAWEKFGNI